MTTINQLSTLDTVSTADQLPIYSTANGDARKASVNTLLETIRDNLGDASATSLTASSYLKITAVLTSNLPNAATVGAGARATVTDATQSLSAGIGNNLVGGGTHTVPVFSDGTNWHIG